MPSRGAAVVRSTRATALVLGIAAVYFGAAKLGLTMASVAEQVSPVWPPTGIALAAILLLGYRVSPGIWLGAFLANATANEPIGTACGIALGNTLEALAGAWLLRRFVDFQPSLERLRDVLGLVGLAALGSTTLSATVGTVSLALGGVQPWAAFDDMWWVWWLGDAIGDLVVAPALLTWATWRRPLPWRRQAEGVALLASLVATAVLVFGGPFASPLSAHPLEYVVFPFVIWAALRFGQRGTATVTFVASGIAIWGTSRGLGPFAMESADSRLVLLQLFMGVVAVSGLLLAAAVAERSRAEEGVRLNEERLRMALSAALMGTWDYDVATGAVNWSDNLERLHGRTPGTFAGGLGAYLDDVHPDDRARVSQAIAEALRTGADQDLEYRIVTPDGGVRWLQGRGHVSRDRTGRPIRMTGVCLDMTARKQAEAEREQLLASERQARTRAEVLNDTLQALVRSSAVGIVVLDPDATVRLWNPAAERIFGWTQAEALGHQPPFVPPESRAEFRANFDVVLRGGIFTGEVRRRRKSGAAVDLAVTTSPLRDAAGRIAGVVLVLADVTERKRAEAASAHLAAIVESSDDAIISKTLDGAIQSWNSGAERLFGYAAEEVIGRPITILIPPDRHAEEQEILDRLRQGKRVEQYETVRVAKDGRRLDVSLTISPVRDASGAVIGASKISRDITERTRVQQEREELLAREQVARSQAEAANRAKDEFLAMLGHELRNPLGAISNAVSVLDRIGNATSDAGRMREVIARQVRHLSRMMDDLLDVARVTTGKVALHRQPVDLRAVAEQCVIALHHRGAARRHEVQLTGESAVVEGDPTRLEQVVGNLLDNALKYTEAGGRVHVQIETEGAESAVLRVKDNGIGIAPDLLPRIFDLFTQGRQSLDRSTGGLGLGLTLVRRLVNLHGGTVTAHSAGLGQGSEFVVRLPLLLGSPLAGRPTPAGTGPRRRILVVEDHPDSRDGLRLLLEWHGHEVDEASDGVTGLERLLASRPDIAFVDIGLPGLDGYAIAQAVRAAPGGDSIYLVALTGYGRPEDARRALDAGFNAHLTKPVDETSLGRVLANARLTGEAA